LNKITREHYPVSKLPEELKKEFEGIETVRLVVEEQGREPTGAAAIATLESRYRKHWDEIAAKGPIDYTRHRDRTTIEEAVSRIRELRDDWDDE
jgi:hypothetical protein